MAPAGPAATTAVRTSIFLRSCTGISWGVGMEGTGRVGQGRVARCGLTVLAKPLPLATSQLIDQVIAPRMPGYVAGGLNVPQLVPRARQSSAALITDGAR